MGEFKISGSLTQDEIRGALSSKKPKIIGQVGFGDGGVSSYNELSDKPKINDVELAGNKTSAQLGLESKRGVDDYYLSGAEKNQGALPTGVTNPSPVSGKNLSTVKKLAQEFDKSFRIIGIYTPIAGDSAIEIKYDMYGNLLSALNIKRLFMDIYVKSTAMTVQIGLLRINNVSSLTYKMTGNLNTGILFRNNAETYMFCSVDFNGILKYATNVSHSPTILDDTTASSLSYIGINRSISNKTLEQIDLILGGAGVTFNAGSIISIYAI